MLEAARRPYRRFGSERVHWRWQLEAWLGEGSLLLLVLRRQKALARLCRRVVTLWWRLFVGDMHENAVSIVSVREMHWWFRMVPAIAPLCLTVCAHVEAGTQPA